MPRTRGGKFALGWRIWCRRYGTWCPRNGRASRRRARRSRAYRYGRLARIDGDYQYLMVSLCQYDEDMLNGPGDKVCW